MAKKLGDFTTDPRRLALLSGCAVLIGVVSAFVAKVLLLLIGFITHVVYFQSIGGALIAPDPRRLGPISILIPIAGGILVGLMARYGSDKIRGHGIPEAIQAILDRDSVIQARVAYLKPIASAITIGTGGPFGAEGPIIMTGGAFGSLFAQFLELSSFERRTLLVCGAAAGMSATFGAPIASVMIAVELLLFEWKPRSFVPVVVASFVADAMRSVLIAPNPPFIIAHPHVVGVSGLGSAVAVGVAGGIVAALMTKLVYATEDAYGRLPIHWMWWPAIGGAVVGIGGWFVPQTLGVGYATIDGILNGNLAAGVVAGIILVKIVIWVGALSSGTSGGVLAPLLMIGGAMGTLMALALPGHDATVWAAVGMAAILAGTMRAPFMATLFALETTHAWGLLPPIFVGCVAATALTVAVVPRSMLTEKLARRGMHVAREYSVHPLELIGVSAVMRPIAADAAFAQGSFVTVHPEDRVRSAASAMALADSNTAIVVNEGGAPVGVLTSDDLLRAWKAGLKSEVSRRRVRHWKVPHRYLPSALPEPD